uniref:Uncharacterized protein n=1 Tax=Rhizophora mucronata TaxID=61149 RepID=A0A2P2QRN2_RHIMU
MCDTFFFDKQNEFMKQQ